MDADADPLDVVEISEPALVAARNLRTSTARKVQVALRRKGTIEISCERGSGSSCSTNALDVACPQFVSFFCGSGFACFFHDDDDYIKTLKWSHQAPNDFDFDLYEMIC